MDANPLLADLGLIVLAALIFVLLSRLARIPSIVAYILAGLALGPILGLVTVTETVDLISEAGIALLLFLVGLELSLDKIRDVGRVAIVAGIGQVVFTAAGGFAFCLLLGFSLIEGVFIATALTFSSTVVVVKLLDQKGELDTVYGRIAVGIFLVQDLVVIVALTFLAGLGTGEAPTGMEMARGVAFAFIGMGALLVVAAVSAKWILPTVFGWLADSQEALFVWSLFWCFLLVLGAEGMGLSLEIGAFLAGISLAQLPYNHDLRRRVHPLMNFFIAVFFVSLGIRMEFGAAAEAWLPAIVLSLFVLVGNPFIFMWIIARMGYGERTSFLTSVTVAQISEFSFIFAAMGLAAGLIDEGILSLVAMVGLVTIAASSYMILYNRPLYEFVRRTGVLRIFGASDRDDEEEVVGLANHVIVVGMNSLGRAIVMELGRKREDVLAIDTDPRKLQELPCGTLLGNAEYLSVLEEAGLERAKLLVSALQIEDTNRLLVYRCLAVDVPCAVHAFDQEAAQEISQLGPTFLIDSRRVGIERLTAELKREGIFSP